MVVNSMSYATYDSYKESGVDWLGAIPSDWQSKKLGILLTEFSKKNNPNLPLLSITRELGVITRDMDDQESNHNFIPDDLSGYKLLKEGQFGMNKMKAWQGSYGISKYTGIVSPAYYVFDVSNEIYPNFFNIAIRSKFYVDFFGSASDGVRIGQWDLNKTRMREIPFIFPSLEQQKKIYEFLSKKIKQIDQAISLKQQQIEKLNEYKQIVIQNAVTKGLNPNAPMKNSGVDWIGDIPEHWDVIRFRNAFRFNKGLNITKENLNDEQGILCLNYGEIHSKYGFEFIPNVHPLKFVDESYLKNNQKSLLNNGDFVFADTSEDIEGSGNFSYINGQDLVFAGYHTLIAKPKINFNSRFIAYVLDSSAFRNQVRVRVKGVKVFSITQAILKTTFIWLPTEQEQNEIVKYLDEKMQKFNNAKIAYQIQIDRLKEYKNILINQAVTGKIKI
jgi:type I restriction enzyme, S subunit